MGRRGSIQLMRILGIRVGVDASWFLVLFLFIFILSGSFRDALDSSDQVAYITAVASAFAFFTSLILHELGHALMARRLGIEIIGIDLWFFGGVARMKRDSQTAGQEFAIAIAGPLVTLAIVIASVVIGSLLESSQAFWDAASLQSGSGASPALVLLGWLATINAFVFVFNLLPAYPLDGGRIARAIVWRITGDQRRATRAAATLGRYLGWVMIGGGVFLASQGLTGSGIWIAILGFIIAQAARGELLASRFQERLDGITVADIMDTEPVSVPAAIPASQAIDEFFLRYRWSWFPVVDAAGRFIGLLRQEQAERAGVEQAGELVDPDAASYRVAADAPIEALIASEPLRRQGALMAVDADGVLRGVVTIEQVRRALAAAAGPSISA